MAHLIHEDEIQVGKGKPNSTGLRPNQRVQLLNQANQVLPLIHWDKSNEAEDAGLAEDLDELTD